MDRVQSLDGFNFDDNAIIYNNVQPVAAVELNGFIDDRKRLLLLDFEASLS